MTFSENRYSPFQVMLQWRQNAPIIEQRCAGRSPNSANRKHQIPRHPRRTSSSLRPASDFGTYKCQRLPKVGAGRQRMAAQL